MRIGIREQLAGLVLICSLVPLAVLAITTWVNNHNFVVDITSKALSLTASLKAAQIAADILLIQATCSTIVTRVLIQSSLRNFYKVNGTGQNWTNAEHDIASALASGGLSALLQVTIFSRNLTGNPFGILNVTADLTGSEINLPFKYDNGTSIKLGDPGLGYPEALYPNITYGNTSLKDPMDPSKNYTSLSAFSDFLMNTTSALFLGPLQVNESFALVSLTLPIIDSTRRDVALGYMTVVASAESLLSVTKSREGLASTGMVLIVGPNRRLNHFRYGNRPATANYQPTEADLSPSTVKYVFPPTQFPGQQDRHQEYIANLSKYSSSNFTQARYPAVLRGFGSQNAEINNASSLLTTHNEQNVSVAVGYARPQSPLVDWLLIVEQSHSEAWAPIIKLRNIVLACVFGTIGLILFLIVPMAHYSVRPIRRLRDATEKSVAPPGYSEDGESIRSEDTEDAANDEENHISPRPRPKKGFFVRLKNLGRGQRKRSQMDIELDNRRRVFKIPAEVPDRKHLITDEVSELTTTFNAMSRELLLQYTSLEDKVAERTEELEISKKAAEAANESKTLFIANISHELKTPLNGILGMCAVCMGEDDLPRIKRSLQVVYKSGDLLLHLLNDLLTFSKNQIGQQLSLEEKEFRLVDVKSQITTIFEKQVREGNIQFKVRFIGTDPIMGNEILDDKKLPALGPTGTGRLKDMSLWGDQHRILQVIINLVSNSLKFTPEGGKVEVRIRCLGEGELSSSAGTRNSMGSKQSSQRSGPGSKHGSSNSKQKKRGRHNSGESKGSKGSNQDVSRKGSNSSTQKKPQGTALLINPMDPNATPRVQVRERSPTPPPSNAKTFIFQFEVEDTGPGIPEALQSSVFEPFVQADLGLSRKFGGTGLGLSICSQLAGLMGGNISLVSTEGSGSTFTMQIPLKYVKSRAPSTSSSDIHGGSRAASVTSQTHDDLNGRRSAEGTRTPLSVNGGPSIGFQKDTQPRLVGLSQPFFAAAPSPKMVKDSSKDHLEALNSVATIPGRKLRVLVAEDNLVNQEVVLRMLKLEDIYDVVVAKDGQEAYDMVRESMSKGEFFNLIFMDIQMPNLDGLESTRLIRQMGYSAPIVALTAFAEESNIKQCYDSGMDEFLSKPIRRPALKQVLKKFATIPEETETSSLTRKSTPEQLVTEVTSTPETKEIAPSTNIPHLVPNGTTGHTP